MKLYGPRTNTIKKKKKQFMNKPKYFGLEEFLESSTALENKIKNYPSWEHIEHLNELALFLDDLREAWGSGLRVTSGLRRKWLNDKIYGASKTSVHQIGYAADIVPVNGKMDEFIEFVKEWAKDKDYDQIILEYSSKSRWVHFGLYNNKHEQRRLLFRMEI